jgi:hypothetical protein
MNILESRSGYLNSNPYKTWEFLWADIAALRSKLNTSRTNALCREASYVYSNLKRSLLSPSLDSLLLEVKICLTRLM